MVASLATIWQNKSGWGKAALKLISRDDQRELNNLGKMIPEQAQGHMMVIDEAKAAHDLLVIARELLASSSDGK